MEPDEIPEPEWVRPPPEAAPGRGTGLNPASRFDSRHTVPDPEWHDPEAPAPTTLFIKDQSQTIISYNDSPDLAFDASVNPYRGCEHGCIYCYARPYHEYLGFSAGLDFETKIVVKETAPDLLRKELLSPKWKPQLIAMSGVTDCYQPIERSKQLTRRCLQVLAEFRNPVAIVTKNFLVTRDADVLREMADHNLAAVFVTVTTLDLELKKCLEPRTSPPETRLKTIRTLAEAGIPVGVLVSPIIPAINDHEMPSILDAAAKAGATFAGRTVLRLPHGVAALFEQWLDQHFPARKDKVLNQVRSFRGGQLNVSDFGKRMRGEGAAADRLSQLFRVACRRAGITNGFPELSTQAFRRPGGVQTELAL